MRPRLALADKRVLDAGNALVERLPRRLHERDWKAGVEERQGDAGAHGAGTKDADRLDVAQLRIGADAGQVGRLPFGEEGILQGAGVGACADFAEQGALSRTTLCNGKLRRRCNGIDCRLGS